MTIQNSFVPNRQIIQSITNANPGVVTTTQDHGYHDGLFVRLQIPFVNGMQQVNGNVYLITVLSSNTFSINENTSNFDSFALNSATQPSEIIPVGEVAETLINAVKNNRNIIPET